MLSMALGVVLGALCGAGPRALGADRREAPMLRAMVDAGQLPPVEQRLPAEPMVVQCVERIGSYGGRVRTIAFQPSHCSEVTHMLWEPPLRFSTDGRRLEPNLARHWEMSDDAREITIHLRPGLRWSDGHPATVDDVLFAWHDVMLNPRISPIPPAMYCPGGTPMELIPVDEHTFRLRFAEPFGSFPYFLTHAIGNASLLVPKHRLKRIHPAYTPIEQVEAEARAHDFELWYKYFRVQNFTARGDHVDTPPGYPTLSAWVMAEAPAQGERIWRRNPYYWKVDADGSQLPYVDEIRSTYVANVEARNLNVIAGEVDFAAAFTNMRETPLYLMHARERPYRVLFWVTNYGTRVNFFFNQTHRDPVLRAIFQDRRFRIAMSHGINRAEINEVLYYGKCRPQQLTVNRGCTFWRAEWEQAHAEYDPDKANRMLDEIGLRRRGPGRWRRRPDGRILVVACDVVAFGFRPETTELVKEYWKDLGVLMSYRQVDNSLWWTRLGANALDCTPMVDDVATDVTLLSTRLYASYMWAPMWYLWWQTSGRQGERPPARIEHYHDLWLEMRRTSSAERRAELAGELLQGQADNLWGIGTVAGELSPIIVHDRLRNVPGEGPQAATHETLWGWPWLATFLHHPEQFYLQSPP